MRKAALWTPLPLALAIGVLVLELGPRGDFEFGTESPPAAGPNVPPDDFEFLRVVPEPRFTHLCAGCGECVHPFTIIENRRILSIRARPAWYRRLWRRDREYFYSDPVQMLGDWGKNRTAQTPRGTWRVRLQAGPATHGSAPGHECGQIPRDLTLVYELVMSDDPMDESFHSGDGPLKIPQTIPWLVANPGIQICLGWRLVGAPAVETGRCPCARP